MAALTDGNDLNYTDRAVLWSLSSPTVQRVVPLGASGVWAGTCGQYVCVTTVDQRLLRLRFSDGSVVSNMPVPGILASPRIASEAVARFVASPDGRLAAIPYTDHVVRLVNVATGKGVRTLGGTTEDGLALAFSPDGRLLAGRDGGTVLVWRVHGSLLPERFSGHAGRVTAAVFTRDGSTLVSMAEDHGMIVWDLSGRSRLGRVLTRQLDNSIVSSVWAAGTRIAVGQRDGALLFIDPRSGAITRAIAGCHCPSPLGYPTVRSGVGSDSLIAARGDGLTTIWSMSTGRMQSLVTGLPEMDDSHGADTWVSRDGRVGVPGGVLEDYGAVAGGFLALCGVTGDALWLERATALLDTALTLFRADDGGFFDTPSDGERLVSRPRDPGDNASPSGTSATVHALLGAHALTGEGRWREAADEALGTVGPLATRAPRFAGWSLAAAQAEADDAPEIAVVGPPGPERDALERRARSWPGAVVVVAEGPRAGIPLLTARAAVGGHAAAYVCRNQVCASPLTQPDDFATARESVN